MWNLNAFHWRDTYSGVVLSFSHSTSSKKEGLGNRTRVGKIILFWVVVTVLKYYPRGLIARATFRVHVSTVTKQKSFENRSDDIELLFSALIIS